MIALVIAVGVACLAAGLIIGAVLTVRWMDRRHVAELERMENMLTVGSPLVPEPEMVSQQPDAVGRARAQIHEDTVAKGIEQLKQKYKERGLTLSDDEARIQVEAMLLGKPPVVG